MSDQIIVALIVAVFGLVGQIVISRNTAKDLTKEFGKQSELADERLAAKLDKYQAVTDSRIQSLADEVRKHNNFAERIPILEEKIKTTNHRIDSLKDN